MVMLMILMEKLIFHVIVLMEQLFLKMDSNFSLLEGNYIHPYHYLMVKITKHQHQLRNINLLSIKNISLQQNGIHS